MSLISALNMTYAGLSNVESSLDAAASNITNADKTGYTRKVYQTDYTTTSQGSTPAGGTVVTAAYSDYLYESLVGDASDLGYYETMAEYLENYATRLGETDDDSTLSSALDTLATALDSLSLTPDDSSLKADVVQSAELLTYEIRSLSESVQELRTQADQDIETAVAEINTALETIDTLNEKIVKAEANGLSTADLEDERRVALETVASYMDIDYYTDGSNQLKVYTGGYALVDSSAHTLSYTASSAMNASVTYPDSIDGIMIGGNDITTAISGGTLGALIELRDETLVDEQEKLDELASTLIEEVNNVLNEGTSLPGRDDITGDVQGFDSSTDISSFDGSVQIATVDDDGVILSTATIDLTTVSTMADLVSAINTAMGGDVTASLTASGELQLVAENDGEYIALNQLDSDMDGQSFSAYFGLNNFFSGDSASNIYVSDYLQDNSELLATSTLDSSAAAGETAIYPGDGTLAATMQDLFYDDVSFDDAGDFSSGSYSLIEYAGKIMSAIAISASNASSEYDTASSLYEATQTSLSNLSGVNIDEEMAMIVELEAKYQASATLMATIQDMYDQLIAAVS